jgi:cytochrome b561
MAAALMHALIYRDGVFQSMAPWRAGTPPPTPSRKGRGRDFS